MIEQAYKEEKEHYVSRVNHFKEVIEKSTKELEYRKVKLEVLNQISGSVESDSGRMILSEDIKFAQGEIANLQKEIIHARGNLKTFESIVKAFKY